MTSITIPDRVKSVEDYAFYGCSSLESVTIGNGVTNIGVYAFGDCDSIEKIYYNGDVNDWVQINGISNLMKYGGKSSKNLYINGELLTEANITIATKINEDAFYSYESLRSVTLGESVTCIEDGAFRDCSLLTSVTFENPNGWYICYSLNATSGTNLTLDDTAQNAEYLTSTYDYYYWKRG